MCLSVLGVVVSGGLLVVGGCCAGVVLTSLLVMAKRGDGVLSGDGRRPRATRRNGDEWPSRCGSREG